MDESLLDAVTASLMAAIGAYSHSVLTRSEDAAAEGTIRLGQRLLARLRRSQPGTDVDSAVLDAAGNPGDPDFRGALRAQVKKAARADPRLAPDLAALIHAGGITIAALGERSVAVQHNEGIIATGDHATNRIVP